MSELEITILQAGFESLQEFYRLVSTVKISTSEKLAAFKKWQTEDGTKAGLLKLFQAQSESQEQESTTP